MAIVVVVGFSVDVVEVVVVVVVVASQSRCKYVRYTHLQRTMDIHSSYMYIAVMATTHQPLLQPFNFRPTENTREETRCTVNFYHSE